jgi:hypothetical protein
MHEIAGVQMDLLLHDIYVYKLQEGIVFGASSVWRESMVLFAKADSVSGGCFQAQLSLTQNSTPFSRAPIYLTISAPTPLCIVSHTLCDIADRNMACPDTELPQTSLDWPPDRR